MRQCRFIREFLLSTAPDPTSFKPSDLRELMKIGRKFLEMGEERMYETIRFWTMSVAEYLDEYYETDVIKAAFSGSGIIGTALGIHSPGTAYVLLHHYMGEVDGNVGSWGYARGGMGAVSRSIAGAFQAAGGELRTEAGVDQIIVKNGKVAGVALENGEEISGRLVVSAMDVKRTFLNCMQEKDLPADFYRRVKNFKIRGSSGKLNIALDGLPTFTRSCRRARRSSTATCTSSTRWNAWSAPTTTGRTASGRRTPTSTCSYRRSTIRPWRRRASTS